VSARGVHLRIGRLVIHDETALSAADLEAAIGQAVRRRLEGDTPPARSLSEHIANGVLGHPDVAAHALLDRGRPARPAHSHAPFMSMSGRDARGPEEEEDMRPPR
jgi:hypothetical protein